MLDMQKLAKMDLDSFGMKAFDWALAIISLGYGLYSGSMLWIVAGLLGGLASWYRPLSRMQRSLNSFVKKRR